MHDVIKHMLAKYKCHIENDYINALKEIFQEIALLGLWRSKFFEHAAFYGGSALRILYGLDRFSEDLDFSLLKPEPLFNLEPYNRAIEIEMLGLGIHVTVTSKIKNIDSNIESAFIKADTKKQLLMIAAPTDIVKKIHSMQTIKIKMEIDINPPGKINTEVKTLLHPIPFTVKTLCQPDLFAGKLHAILCRPWQKRVKGRDWYDMIWYISHDIPVNLTHLKERLIQTNAWQPHDNFSLNDLNNLLKEKINITNFENAKLDILPFVKDPASIALWSTDFFLELIKRLNSVK